ncbi:MAG: histidine phosphatase family protein [Ruminiclostridium sp.]|nr:histidine phosphatase family protein [Ruminiclostridium sp.]
MKILLVRHGETDWNLKNKVLGRTDIPLNEKGIKQAEILAEQLKANKIDIMITSPLQRAIETGAIITEKLNLDCECIIESCLIEQNYGIFEGVDRNDAQYQNAKRNFFSKYKDGESFLDVAARVYPFIKGLSKLNVTTCLIVTHNGICRIISNYFENMTNEEFATFSMSNCEIKEYVL